MPRQPRERWERQTARTRKGSKWLRSALVEAAHAAGRKEGSYLAAQYQRLVARRGKKRAAVAVGHTLLTIVYFLLTRGTVYQDLGATYFDQRDHVRVKHRLVHRLEALGYTVRSEPSAA